MRTVCPKRHWATGSWVPSLPVSRFPHMCTCTHIHTHSHSCCQLFLRIGVDVERSGRQEGQGRARWWWQWQGQQSGLLRGILCREVLLPLPVLYGSVFLNQGEYGGKKMEHAFTFWRADWFVWFPWETDAQNTACWVSQFVSVDLLVKVSLRSLKIDLPCVCVCVCMWVRAHTHAFVFPGIW